MKTPIGYNSLHVPPNAGYSAWLSRINLVLHATNLLTANYKTDYWRYTEMKLVHSPFN